MEPMDGMVAGGLVRWAKCLILNESIPVGVVHTALCMCAVCSVCARWFIPLIPLTLNPKNTLNNLSGWRGSHGLIYIADLPFTVRPQLRKEMSLAKFPQARHRLVTLHRAFKKVLSHRQELVS